MQQVPHNHLTRKIMFLTFYLGLNEMYLNTKINFLILGTSMFGCSNDKVALKSYYGKYVVAESDGNANANRLLRGESEIFTVEKLGDDYCALKSKYGKYLVAESNEQDVNANRSVAGPWETFTVLKQTDGTYAIKTAHGRYLVAKPDGRLKGNSRGVGDQEKFTAECITSA